MIASQDFTTHTGISIATLISHADMVAKLVLILLVGLSIWSWTIVIDRFLKYRTIIAKMKNFEDVFWAGSSIDQLYERVKRSANEPLSAIFVAAMNECNRHDKKYVDPASRVGLKERIYQAANLVRNREAEKLETGLNVLATIASNAPFVGIFGMVWSIINSFHAIASTKNVSISTIAPSISEALFVTAVGLFVAIPAAMFYNILVAKSNVLINKMEDFGGELHTLLSRAIDEGKI